MRGPVEGDAVGEALHLPGPPPRLLDEDEAELLHVGQVPQEGVVVLQQLHTEGTMGTVRRAKIFRGLGGRTGPGLPSTHADSAGTTNLVTVRANPRTRAPFLL